MLQTKDS